MSVDVAAFYCEVVKEGFSEIRREVATQGVDRWDRAETG